MNKPRHIQFYLGVLVWLTIEETLLKYILLHYTISRKNLFTRKTKFTTEFFHVVAFICKVPPN